MIKQLQKFTVQMLSGANVATIVSMLLLGYSDRLNPVDHPMLSTVGMAFPIFLVLNLLFLVVWLLFKWTRVWIPIVGFALAYVPISIYMPLRAAPDVPDDALKLVSYNVCGYGGNYKYEKGFEVIRDYLREQKPDIVCVQEDVDSKGQNVMTEYGKLFASNDTVVICNTSDSKNVIGIHTRFPIIRSERIDYPSATNGSVAWWLKTEHDTLIVVNNHFESCHLNKEDRHQYRQILHGEMDRDSVRKESQTLLIKLAEANAKRAPQIEAVLRYVEEHSQYPVIVCGDFNDNPISYSRHRMSQVLTDCFATTGRGIGLSYNQKAFSFRIDHVFCSSQLTPYYCKVDNDIDASDHFPVVCWLKMSLKH